jgi:glycosyltransferase involved in cell wall biosynthesis
MKILFLITRADTVGGAQVHVKDLALSLIQQGHEVLVITGVKGYYNTVLEKDSIDSIACETLVKQISPIKDSLTLSFLTKIIRQYQPDLVTTHSSKAGILGRLACKLTNTPCIFTVHGWAFTEGVSQPSRTIYQILERLTELLADKIICVSENDRLLGIKIGMNPNRLVTIHNGTPDISEQFRAKLDTSKQVSIIMVARFDQQKDHLTLIKALQNVPIAEVTLIGDGPNLNSIQNLVEELGMVNRVKFFGYCDNVVEKLAQAHIFTLISNWEGFPLTTIEAMRAGLPVVASNVGGVAEAVEDGVTGYLVERGDIETLRTRLSGLINNVRLRQEMGKKGREKYESEFTFYDMFERTCQVYEEVLKKR